MRRRIPSEVGGENTERSSVLRSFFYRFKRWSLIERERERDLFVSTSSNDYEYFLFKTFLFQFVRRECCFV